MGISDSGTRITLRLSEQLHQLLTIRARQSQRSLNSEIAYTLLQSTKNDYTAVTEKPSNYLVNETTPEHLFNELVNQCKSMSAAQQQGLLQLLREFS